jgi:hypothetical protein
MKQSLVVLNPELHQNLTFSQLPIYPHAINLTQTPLLYSEFIQAGLSYPILFSQPEKEGQIIAVAVLGTKKTGKNQFIDTNSGHWRSGHYIPATVATYPFHVGPLVGNGNGQQTLLIDIDAPHFDTKNGTPLYTQQGEPTQILNNIISRFNSIKKVSEQTNQLIMQLVHADLLKAKKLVSKTGESSKTVLDEYFALDPQQLAKIPKEQLIMFHERGLLPYLYSATSSLGTLKNLVAEKQPEQSAATPTTDQPPLVDTKNRSAHKPVGIIFIAFLGVALLSGLVGYHLNSTHGKESATTSSALAGKQIPETHKTLASQQEMNVNSDRPLPEESPLQDDMQSKKPPNDEITPEPQPAIVQNNVIDEKKTDRQQVDAEPIIEEPISPPATIAVAQNDEEQTAPVTVAVTSVIKESGASKNTQATVEELGFKDTLSDNYPPKPRIIQKSAESDIEWLIKMVRENIYSARLSNPRGDNAMEKISRIKNIDPENQIVPVLLEEVFKRYLGLAAWSSTKKAHMLLDKAQSILPGDQRVEEVRTRIEHRNVKQQNLQ